MSPLHRAFTPDLDVATLYKILALRVDVFVVEQACPYRELDGRDLEPTTRQMWATEGDDVVATLRLLEEDGPIRYRIGRVCTRRDQRGKGLTDRLMRLALAEVGRAACVVESQSYLVGMYTKLGFIAQGAEYLVDGIPHIEMVRPGG